MRKVLVVVACLGLCFLVPVFALANPVTTVTGSPIPNGLAEKQLQERKAKLERSRALLGVLEETYQAYEKGNENNPAIMEELAQIRAAIPEANCDESLFLRAQGKGRILVRVFYRGQPVSIGGPNGKAIVKVMGLKEKYMDFHDQGGLIVSGGKSHEVRLYMPGRMTVSSWPFVSVGETNVVEMEIGPKMKIKKSVSKKTQKCSASVSDTTRQVQQPFVPKTSGTVEVPAPVECTSGDCYYLNLPVGTK